MKKPDWAITVWSDEDWIYADIPSAVNGHSHTVKFPNDSYGLRQALRLVRVRKSSSKLGFKGSPTQHQIDKMVKNFDPMKIKRAKTKLTREEDEKVTMVLRKLGYTGKQGEI